MAKTKYSLEYMKSLALDRSGLCLSSEFKNVNTKLRWQCKKGHIWSAEPYSILRGTWCKYCFGFGKTIFDMQKYAESKNGKCLSEKYINTLTNLLWKCSKGHEWKARPSNILRGGWCPKCMGRDHTIFEMNQWAKDKGGVCLSDKYINNITKLSWKCREGHEWEASPSSIQSGSWCPKCSTKKTSDLQRTPILDLQQLAIGRNGLLLSSTYLNSRVSLKWQCAQGHQWMASVPNIKKGGWCPRCTEGISEASCRTIMELAFDKSFKKVRPEWLVNSKGNKMELDGYCQELGLAFEYNGAQHYKTNHFFTHENIIERKKFDNEKLALCKKERVNLIVVPYTVLLKNIPNYLYEECKKFGLKVNRSDFKWKPEEVYHARVNLIVEMQRLALKRGGRCISKIYINAHAKLEWECEKGHRWLSSGNCVKRGSWCQQCSKDRLKRPKKHSIESMNVLALKHGGKCISTIYKSTDQKLLWQCAKGHEWEALPANIQRGSWCRICYLNNFIPPAKRKKLGLK